MLSYLSELDTDLFLFLNSFHSEFWDIIMWHITLTKTWIPVYAIILFFVFKKYRLRGFYVLLAMILLVILADRGSVELFKNIFKRLRPCQTPYLQANIHTINGKCGGMYGFISSHASNTFAFATFIVFLYKRLSVSIGILFWALIVSYSRIYIGVHYPGDILGGIIFGTFLGFFVFKLYIWFDHKNYFKL